MKIDRTKFELFVGLVLYENIQEVFYRIKSINLNGRVGTLFSYKDSIVTHSIDLCDQNKELHSSYKIFGEPDFPKERMPVELITTEFKKGCRYFYCNWCFMGILDIINSDKSNYYLHSNYYDLSRNLNLFGLRVNYTKDKYDSLLNNSVCLIGENIKPADILCKHFNKKQIYYGIGNKGYIQCLDCKEDLGDI